MEKDDVEEEDNPLASRIERLENCMFGERGILSRLSVVETDMKWVKKTLTKIDRRSWYVLGSVVALGVIAILIALFG